MDPDYLLFVRIIELGSMSAAARASGTTPATVSKRLARLERRLGTPLILRTTRRLAPTAAGERFHADLIAILADLSAARDRLTGAGGDISGPLRVTVPTSFGRLHILPRLHAFLDRYPGIELAVDLDDGFVEFMPARVHLAIRIAASVPAGLSAVRLASNPRLLCASPAYLKRRGVPATLEELTAHQLLAANGQLPWRLQQAGEIRLVDGSSHVQTNSSEAVRELAVTGVGIALRSFWDVGRLLADGALVPVLADWQAPHDLAIWAVFPGAAPDRAAAALIAFLQQAFIDEAWQ